MTEQNRNHKCPHCGGALKPIRMPYEGGLSGEIHLVCFNNDCGYYQRGWARMMQEYETKASYRYRLDPETGASFPLAVWSDTAMLDRIIESDD